MLFINGEMQEQKALPGNKRSIYRQRIEQLGDVAHQIQLNNTLNRNDDRSLVVPEGHYYMMGDNRDNSADSREWGPVPESRIVVQAVAIWMHKKPGWNLPTFARAGGFD
ncbi:MAG: signal peptidase I [Pseudomonadales bacterium]|nr:signal peptidase I [Pseudomonadales bacterium]